MALFRIWIDAANGLETGKKDRFKTKAGKEAVLRRIDSIGVLADYFREQNSDTALRQYAALFSGFYKMGNFTPLG